jgi:hypothetical protein
MERPKSKLRSPHGVIVEKVKEKEEGHFVGKVKDVPNLAGELRNRLFGEEDLKHIAAEKTLPSPMAQSPQIR